MPSFPKVLSVAQHLMAHPELLDQGKEPMRVAIDYVYNLDVGVQAGRSYIPARCKLLTPAKLVEFIHFTTNILQYTKFNPSAIQCVSRL